MLPRAPDAARIEGMRPSPILRTLLLLPLALACGRAEAQDITGLYLTWDGDPTTTMVVNWVDLYPDSSDVLVWRREGAAEWREALADQTTVTPTSLQRRRVELAGLEPDARYEFAIGKVPDQKTAPLAFRTLPKDLSARALRFVNGGDTMATREMFEAMCRRSTALDPDFVVFGGDLAYEDGVKATRVVDWLEAWTRTSVAKDRRVVPLICAIGNHEVRGHFKGKVPSDAPYYYGLFAGADGVSQGVLDCGSYLSLVLLDSNHTTPVEGAQAQWLERVLDARSEVQFLFPVYHYPAWGTTKAPKDGTPLDAPLAKAIREHWVPLFERHGISAAFEHDHHNFKRTHRILAGKRDDERGLLYLGDGAFGVTPRTVPAEGSAWWLAKAEARNHLWCADLRADGTASLRAIDAKGEVFDAVELAAPRTQPVGP
jgi:3',5'-cyclic AMP phosphodiesterase CpdA